MPGNFRKPVVVALASALALSTLNLAPAQATTPVKKPQAQTATTLSLSARSRHHRHHRHWRHYRHHRHHDARMALRLFGAFAGAMAGIAARNNCHYYGRCYYGYAPRYYYRY